MSSSSGTTGDLSLSRKLTDEEGKEVRLRILPFLVQANAGGGEGGGDDDDGDDAMANDTSEEDMNDFIDYIVAMLNNAKTVSQCVDEMTEMDMPFCPQPTAQRIGEELASLVQQIMSATTGTGGESTAPPPPGEKEDNHQGGNGDAEGGESLSQKKVSFLKISSCWSLVDHCWLVSPSSAATIQLRYSSISHFCICFS
jgi:hypothetical protein